jgi:hypothetical protein
MATFRRHDEDRQRYRHLRQPHLFPFDPLYIQQWVRVSPHLCLKVTVGLRKLDRGPLSNSRELRTRRRHGCSRCQAAEHEQFRALSTLDPRRIHEQRGPILVVEWKAVFRGHDANDGEQPVVDARLTPNDGRIRRITSTPRVVSNDQNRGAPGISSSGISTRPSIGWTRAT